MSYTLAQLAYYVASALGMVSEGTATGGSATTIVDSVDRSEAADYWNGGVAWVLHDAGGASAAPEGEYSTVTDFVDTTHTITFGALTTAVAAGDYYAVSKPRFPMSTLNQFVNAALRDLGTIPYTDTTTLTTASDQTEYSLPIAANLDLRQVWIQTETGDSDDNRWQELFPPYWSIQRTAIGTADLLVFSQQPPEPYALKLVYMASHPTLVAYNDKLSETVPLERVVDNAVFKCLNWYRQKTLSNDKSLLDDIGRYEQKAKDNERMYPIPAPRKSGNILMVSQGVSFPKDISDISTVRL